MKLLCKVNRGGLKLVIGRYYECDFYQEKGAFYKTCLVHSGNGKLFLRCEEGKSFYYGDFFYTPEEMRDLNIEKLINQ